MPVARRTAAAVDWFGGRDFTVLWSGYTASSFGTNVTLLVLPLVALLTLDASPFEVGVVSAAGTAAWLLFGLTAGVWVDRLPHRPLLVACDVARAVALVAIPVTALTGALNLPLLVVVAFVVSAGSVFHDIAFQTFIPTVVEPSALITANSRLQGSDSVAHVAGPSLGGTIVGVVGAPATLLVDVVSYVASAASVLAVGTRQERPAHHDRPGMLPQIREGLRYVVRDRALGPLALSAAVINMSGVALDTLAIIFLVRVLELPTALVGTLIATAGVGGVAGAFSAGWLSRRFGGAGALRLAVVAGPLLALLIPFAAPGVGLVLFAVGNAGLSASIVVFSIGARTYRQIVTPPELLGRVTATIKFVSWGVMPLGGLLAGVLGEVLGTHAALWTVCLLFLLVPVPLFASPLRRAREFREEPAAATAGADGEEGAAR